MKYKLLKDLPTFKAGTEAWLSEHGNLITLADGEILVIYAGSTLDKFPNILAEWFEPIEEKRKVVPDIGEHFWNIYNDGSYCILENNDAYTQKVINQGNWRWTEEEAKLEVRKRAAIERVHRYLVRNDLLEEDKDSNYLVLFTRGNIIFTQEITGKESYYSPYGRIKKENINHGIIDCREDLLLIHS